MKAEFPISISQCRSWPFCRGGAFALSLRRHSGRSREPWPRHEQSGKVSRYGIRSEQGSPRFPSNPQPAQWVVGHNDEVCDDAKNLLMILRVGFEFLVVNRPPN